MNEHGSSSEVAKEQKGDFSTSSNLAYGQMKKEEGVKDYEYEMCDMSSDAAIYSNSRDHI